MPNEPYYPKHQRISRIALRRLEVSVPIAGDRALSERDARQTQILCNDTEQYGFDASLNQNPLLAGAFGKYSHACVCGVRYVDNCAHFLSNTMLLQDPNITFPAAMAKCASGRLIRAKEMMTWFSALPGTQFKQDHTGITDFYWFVYQEDHGGQGHVCIHYDKTGEFAYKGTGDYPGWPIQWHYLY